MTPAEVVHALTDLATKAGIEVRVERFELALAGKGGLCRIEGKPVLLVDAKLGLLEQAGVIGHALSRIDLAHAGVDVPLSIRAYVRTGHGQVRPLVRPAPARCVRQATSPLVGARVDAHSARARSAFTNRSLCDRLRACSPRNASRIE